MRVKWILFLANVPLLDLRFVLHVNSETAVINCSQWKHLVAKMEAIFILLLLFIGFQAMFFGTAEVQVVKRLIQTMPADMHETDVGKSLLELFAPVNHRM